MSNDLRGEDKMIPHPAIICADFVPRLKLEGGLDGNMRHRPMQLYGHFEVIRAIYSTIDAFFKDCRLQQ